MKNKNSIFGKMLFAVLIQCLPCVLTSQNYFQKVYPTTYDKTSRDILPTPDGGYILVGMTNNSDITDCDLYIMKTDAVGTPVWTKSYGGIKPDYAYSMCETNDGNYFVVGYSQSFGGGDYDIYLIKFDPSGTKLWEKTYGGSGNEEGTEIIKTSDGNYVIVGTSGSFSSTQDAFLIKIDIAGTVLWTKTYGGSNKELANSVKQCSDGGYILTGQTFSFGQNGDTYLVRTNSAGDTLWTKHYTSSLADEGVSIVVNNDGSFAIAVRDSSAANDVDIRVIKTDPSGTVIWNKLYGANLKDTPKSICKTSDGGYLVGGMSRSFGWINPDMWLLKLDVAGDTTWSRHYGGADHEHCYVVKESPDGGYLAAGHSWSYGPGQKIMFVKMNIIGTLVASVREQHANTYNINVYPNPVSNGMINVCLEDVPLKIKLSNSAGQVVFEKVNGENSIKDSYELNLGTHQQGVYFLNVETIKAVVTKKIIIGN